MNSMTSHVKLWTVSIIDMQDCDMDVWTHIFETEADADAYIERVNEKLEKYKVKGQVKVSKDYTETIGEDFYLGFLDERYGEDNEYD